jgi:hypothetical protein
MKTTKRRKRVITLCLPDEFIDLCEDDSIDPETVLRGQLCRNSYLCVQCNYT